MDLLTINDHLMAGGGGRLKDGGVPCVRFFKAGGKLRGSDANDPVQSNQFSNVASRMLMDGLPTARAPKIRSKVTETSDNYLFLNHTTSGAATSRRLQRRTVPKSARTHYEEYIAREAVKCAARAQTNHISGWGSVLIQCTPRSCRMDIENGCVRLTKEQVRQQFNTQCLSERGKDTDSPVTTTRKALSSSRSAASATSIPNRASARLSSQTARSECKDKVEASGAKSTRQKTARSEASSSMLSSTSTRLLESHKKGVEKEVQLLRRRLQLIDEAIAGAESRIEE